MPPGRRATGLRLTERVFDAFTVSQNRRCRFDRTDIAQRIFGHIAEQAVARELVGGHVLDADDTHRKASANKGRVDTAMIARSRAACRDDPDAAVSADRAAHGKTPPAPQDRQPEGKETRVSRTGGDAGYMVRDGKPTGFFDLDHRTVDGRAGIITDPHVTPANVHDSPPCRARLDRQRDRFSPDVKAVGPDAGHASAPIAHGPEERGIPGVTGDLRPSGRKGMLRKSQVAYDAGPDVCRCPERQVLPDASTDRTGGLPPLQIRPRQVPGWPATGCLHDQCQNAEDHRPPRLDRCPRTGGSASPDRLGQTVL